MTLKEALGRVLGRGNLTREEMAAVMGLMLAGEATPAQVGAFAAALRMKGETEDELLGAAEAMRLRAAKHSPGGGGAGHLRHGRRWGAHVQHLHGGGLRGRGRGVTVAKHGNRAVSSRCGSADVLAALGVPWSARTSGVHADIDEHGVGVPLRAVAPQRPEARGAGARGRWASTASSTCWAR